MYLNGHVQINFTSGTVPGTVQAAAEFVAEDGSTYPLMDPTPVGAGGSVQVGPVGAECDLSTSASYQAAGAQPAGGGPAGAGAQPAKAGATVRRPGQPAR